MIVCETPRLRLRHLTRDDAPFILELLNEPDFIRNIGDREVRTLADARGYIQNGPVASYNQHGFGLYLVETRDDATPVGICGLLKRNYLDDVDVGFALRAGFRGRGYAFEAAAAVMRHGHQGLGLSRIVAITAPDNDASMKVLRRLGLEFERNIRVPDQARDTRLFTPGAQTMAQSLLSLPQSTDRGEGDEEAKAGGSPNAEAGGSHR
jgi:ribosomal-protein-alanine N-acetyltransferase